MGAYEKYSRWPEWVRWLLCFPVSLVGATALAWLFRLATLVYDETLGDLCFPILWQSLFLWFIFFTVPRGKMGFLWTFFSLRTLFSVGYFVIGFWGLYMGIETSREWKYWKGGIAEVIVFVGSLMFILHLREELPNLRAERTE